MQSLLAAHFTQYPFAESQHKLLQPKTIWHGSLDTWKTENIVKRHICFCENAESFQVLSLSEKKITHDLDHYPVQGPNCLCTADFFSAKLTQFMLLFSCSVVSDSFVIPWTIALQAPLFRGFPRQEYWGGLPFPSPGDLPNPGSEL